MKETRDLAGRKQTEEALRESEERFRALVENSPDAIVFADGRGNIIYFNNGAERIFGYSATEMIGGPLTRLMPERFHDAHREGLERFLLTGKAHVIGKTVELAGRRKDGTEFPVELALATWRTGDETFFAGILRDITERKRAEEKLRQSEERFRLLVEGVRDYAILMLDSDGRIISWNEGAQRIMGYRAEEIVGQNISRFYTSEDMERGHPTHLLKAAASEGRVGDEGWRVRQDGTRFWADVVITALWDNAWRLRGFAKVTRDLTDRKRAEEETLMLNKQLSAANQESEAFSYSVSHDLRAPLRSIDGFSQALLEDHKDQLDERGKEYLHRMRAAAQRMSQLIDDLLELSRLTRSEMRREEVDLSAMARRIADELQKTHLERRVKFRVREGVTAHGDARLLRVMLENLLGNAWKFTAKRPQATIEFGVLEKNGKPIYFVRDNGAGFDMAYADKLFGAFQRLHNSDEFSGTGIGLATVQRLVHRHGGSIWAEGEVGQGATFYFTLN